MNEKRTRPFTGDLRHVLEGTVGGALPVLANLALHGSEGFDPVKLGAYIALGAIAGLAVPDENPLVVLYHAVTLPAVVGLFHH